MNDIREKLNLMLISALVIISVLFIVYMIALYRLGINLSPEAYAQIISALATLLVVVLTLGLRLIDDSIKRYERFSMPKISGLKSILEPILSELANHNLVNLPNRCKELDNPSCVPALEKHGKFFLIKLYPQETLDKIEGISNDLKKFLALVEDLRPYCPEKVNFDIFWKTVDAGKIEEVEDATGTHFNEAIFNRQREKLENEKPHLTGQIKAMREKMLSEIGNALKELRDFLEAN